MRSFPRLSTSEGERLREELARQYRIIRGEFLPRIILVAVAYGLCSLFIPPVVAGALFLVEILGEFISQRLLRGLDPVRSPRRYLGFLLSLVPMEAAIISAAGWSGFRTTPMRRRLPSALWWARCCICPRSGRST